MKRTLSKWILIWAAAVFLASCTHIKHKQQVTTQGDAVDQEMNVKLAVSHDSAVNDTLTIKIKGRPYLGAKSSPLTDEDLLPPLFSTKVNYGFPGRENLRTVAERITKIYGVPVRIKSDVFETGFAPHMPVSAPDAKAGPVVQPLSPSPITTFSSNAQQDVEITDWSGPFPGLLDLIAARLGIYWEYKNGTIVFYRTVTKTFTVNAVPGDSMFNAGVGTNGGGGGNGTNNFSSTGQVNMNSQWSLWTSLRETLSRVTRPDRFYVSEAQGSVTITETPEVVELVGKIVEQANALGNRQVAVRMEMVTLTRRDGNEEGFDWEPVLARLQNLVPQWRIALDSPSSVVSSMAGGISGAILAPVTNDASTTQRMTGTQALVRLLKNYGDVNSKRTVGTITMNRNPAPLAIKNTVSYLARTTPGVSGVGGGSTLPGLEPGVVSTGFVANVLPTILDNNAVLLKVSIDASELQKMGIISTGQGATLQSIQTPEVASVASVNIATLQPGQSLVLTGFEFEKSQYEQRGLTDHIGLGGSYAGNRVRERVMLVITPTVIGGA